MKDPQNMIVIIFQLKSNISFPELNECQKIKETAVTFSGFTKI